MSLFPFPSPMPKQLMALPRYAKADEIAAIVTYLDGPEAGFVTRRQPDRRRRVHGVSERRQCLA